MRAVKVMGQIECRIAMSNAENLIWIDLEMTGLVPETDDIIEIATIVTDRDLNVLAEGPAIAVHQPEPALEHAERASRALALTAARRAGAADPHVDTSVSEKRAHVGPGSDYLAEAVVRSTAVGRPFAGHERARIG